MTLFLNIEPEMLQQITTIATVLIAVAALFLTIWQFRAMRIHNRLSVKPLLSYEIMYVRTDRGFGIYICNNGVGPAIVRNFKIFVDNNEIISTRRKLLLEAVKVLKINYPYVQLYFFDDGTSMSAGEKLPLLTVDENIKKDQEKLFQDALPRIDIEIKYESIYKQRFTSRLKDMA